MFNCVKRILDCREKASKFETIRLIRRVSVSMRVRYRLNCSISLGLTGQVFVQNARRFGLLEIINQVDEAALGAAKEAKDRRARAQAFDEFRILVLDALGDPKKRAQVRKQFVSLYGAPEAAALKREACDVTCSGC